MAIAVPNGPRLQGKAWPPNLNNLLLIKNNNPIKKKNNVLEAFSVNSIYWKLQVPDRWQSKKRATMSMDYLFYCKNFKQFFYSAIFCRRFTCNQFFNCGIPVMHFTTYSYSSSSIKARSLAFSMADLH